MTCHPDKRLSPNASLPGSVQAKMARARVVKQARQDGYLAARAVFSDSALLYTLGLDVETTELLANVARTKALDEGVDIRSLVEYAGLHECQWLIGPLSIDTTVWWGYGAGRKDDDNCTAMCKAYRDGVSDWLGTSDRQWWNAGPPVQIVDRKTWPHGRLLFTLTPRV